MSPATSDGRSSNLTGSTDHSFFGLGAMFFLLILIVDKGLITPFISPFNYKLFGPEYKADCQHFH